jgi:hypothetical protein
MGFDYGAMIFEKRGLNFWILGNRGLFYKELAGTKMFPAGIARDGINLE